MITLRSSDGEIFEVEEAVASEMPVIKLCIEDGSSVDDIIPVPKVTSKILAIVIVYCKRHLKAVDLPDETLKQLDADFLLEIDWPNLLDLTEAAHYLGIESLLDLTTQHLADKIENKTPEEVRALFKIKNDFTAEEEEKIRRENELKLCSELAASRCQ